jgi:hypothetical protein
MPRCLTKSLHLFDLHSRPWRTPKRGCREETLRILNVVPFIRFEPNNDGRIRDRGLEVRGLRIRPYLRIPQSRHWHHHQPPLFLSISRLKHLIFPCPKLPNRVAAPWNGATFKMVHTRASLSSFRLRGRDCCPVHMQDVRRWRLSCSLAITAIHTVCFARLAFAFPAA